MSCLTSCSAMVAVGMANVEDACGYGSSVDISACSVRYELRCGGVDVLTRVGDDNGDGPLSQDGRRWRQAHPSGASQARAPWSGPHQPTGKREPKYFT